MNQKMNIPSSPSSTPSTTMTTFTNSSHGSNNNNLNTNTKMNAYTLYGQSDNSTRNGNRTDSHADENKQISANLGQNNNTNSLSLENFGMLMHNTSKNLS